MAHAFNDRRDMPQISIEDMPGLTEWLKETHGMTLLHSFVSPHVLHDGQIGVLFDAARFDWRTLGYPVLVSDDLYIIDGHHRNEAHKRTGTLTPAAMLPLPFTEALDLIRAYPHATHATTRT